MQGRQAAALDCQGDDHVGDEHPGRFALIPRVIDIHVAVVPFDFVAEYCGVGVRAQLDRQKLQVVHLADGFQNLVNMVIKGEDGDKAEFSQACEKRVRYGRRVEVQGGKKGWRTAQEEFVRRVRLQAGAFIEGKAMPISCGKDGGDDAVVLGMLYPV